MKKSKRKRNNVKETKKKAIKTVVTTILFQGGIVLAVGEGTKMTVDFVWDKYLKKSDFYLHTEFNAYVAGEENEK